MIALFGLNKVPAWMQVLEFCLEHKTCAYISLTNALFLSLLDSLNTSIVKLIGYIQAFSGCQNRERLSL